MLELNRRRFKKSGEFDRLRRELLTQFQHSVRAALLQSCSSVLTFSLGADRKLPVASGRHCTAATGVGSQPDHAVSGCCLPRADGRDRQVGGKLVCGRVECIVPT